MVYFICLFYLNTRGEGFLYIIGYSHDKALPFKSFTEFDLEIGYI